MSVRFSANPFDIAQAAKGPTLVERTEGMREKSQEEAKARKYAQREYFDVLYKSLCAGIKPEICAANVESVCAAHSGASPSWSLGELIENAKTRYRLPPDIVIPQTPEGLVGAIKTTTPGGFFETKWSSFVSLADSKMSEERVVLDRGGDPEIASKEEESPAIKKLNNMAAWSAFYRAAEKQYQEFSFRWTDNYLRQEGELDLTLKDVSAFEQAMQKLQQPVFDLESAPKHVSAFEQDIQKLQAVSDRKSALVEKLCKKMGGKSSDEFSTVELIEQCISEGGTLHSIARKLSEQPNLSSLKDKCFYTSEELAMTLSDMQHINKLEDKAVKKLQSLLEGRRCKIEDLVTVIQHALKRGGTLISLQQKATALPGMQALGDRVIESNRHFAQLLFNLAPKTWHQKIHEYNDLGQEGELDLTPKRISAFKQDMQEIQQQDIQKLQAVSDLESELVEKLCKKMGDNSLTERSTVKLIFECTAKGGDLDRIVHILSEQPGLSSLKDKRLDTSKLVRMLSNISKMQHIDKCEDEAVKKLQSQLQGGRCKVENLVKVIRHAVKNGGTLISLQQKATATPGMKDLGDRVISSEKDLAHALVELAPKPSLNTHRKTGPTAYFESNFRLPHIGLPVFGRKT